MGFMIYCKYSMLQGIAVTQLRDILQEMQSVSFLLVTFCKFWVNNPSGKSQDIR